MKKRNVRWISFLVTLLLAFSGVPVQAFALEDEAEVTSPPVAAEEMTTEYVEVVEDEVIGRFAEVVERREENVKHYRMNDGTYQAVVYGSAVHRKDADGAWKDIDNRLYASAVGGEQSFATLDGRVRMAERFTTAEPLLTLSEGETSIAMTWLPSDTLGGSLSTAPMTLPTIVNAAEKAPLETFSDFAAAAEVDNRTSIVYADVAAGTDLEYILDGNDVKENILVKAKRASYEYTVLLTLSGLTATAEASGAIMIADAETGVRKYRIPAPYMYDSTGEISYAVAYELTEVKEGLYLLTVTADAEWINAEGRALPVTIDPTLEYEPIIFDAYVDSSHPNTNFGFDEVLKIGTGKMAYVRMMMPNLPSGATVSGGAFYFYGKSGGSAGNITLYVYRPYTGWEEDTITYNNMPDVSSHVIDQRTYTLPASSSSATPQRMVLDVSEVIDDWYLDEDANYGVRISGSGGSGVVMNLMAYEADEYYPFMTVTYTYDVADGVYAIRVPDMQYYMTVANDSATAGGILQTRYYFTSPATQFNNVALWKISKVGTNRYVIRSMINNNLGLGVSGTQVVTKTLPANDAAVPTADTFLITWDGRGYRITTGDGDYQLEKNGTPGNLTVVDADTATETARWELQQYTGAHRGGINVVTPESWASIGAVVPISINLPITGWSTYINANSLYVEQRSNRADYNVSWNASTNVMTFEALTPGQISVPVKIRNSNSAVSLQTFAFVCQAVPQEGVYIIKNKGTGKYMEVENSSTVAGAIIQQGALYCSTSQKWEIEHVAGSGGYVRIKSVLSNKYLSIDSSDYTEIKQLNAQNDYSLWKFMYFHSNSVMLICKATENTDYVLQIPYGQNNDGEDLTQGIYVDDANYEDEWCLYKAEYSAVVNVYYDNGFLARYGDGDEEDEGVQLILNCHRLASEFYLQNYGLAIEFNMPTYYASALDQCKGPNGNVDAEVCNCNQNHAHEDGLTADFGQTHVGTNLISYAFWSGHKIKNSMPDGTIDWNRSFSNGYSMYLIHLYEPEGYVDKITMLTRILIHELAHQYGVRDHYHVAVKDNEGNLFCKYPDICSDCDYPGSRPETCSMYNSTAVQGLCDGCQEELYAHLNDHH